MEYSVFSDESYISAERFRSIGAFSFPKSFEDRINDRLRGILSDSNVMEFKWKKLGSAKYRFCAEKLINYLLENIFTKKFRVDVIVWDTHDSRHKIIGRDDTANFERMFFHLMKNLMTRREKEASWYIYPDERFDIDWITIQECLDNVGKWREYFGSQLFGDAFSEQFFRIRDFKQVDSKNRPCSHISDLFAGIAVFSKKSYDKYRKWCEKEDRQMCLFGTEEEVTFSKKEKERFYILEKFTNKCKSMRLGVSINTKRCLYTPDPNRPINFWHYTPQHFYDKAPTKSQ